MRFYGMYSQDDYTITYSITYKRLLHFLPCTIIPDCTVISDVASLDCTINLCSIIKFLELHSVLKPATP